MALEEVEKREKMKRSVVEKKSKKRVNLETSFVPLSIFHAFAMKKK